MSSVDMSRLTAIVHTSGRMQSVARLVSSLAAVDSRMKILVADDGRPAAAVTGAAVVQLPPDAGASAGRNALLARVRTPYFLVVEDDMELPRGAGVARLLEAASGGEFDLVAGDVMRCRRRFGLFTRRVADPCHATIEPLEDGLKLAAGHRPGAGGVYACDAAHNFFVARTDRVRAMGGWDALLTVDERIEFFVRARQFKVRVGYCPAAVAWRWADKHAAVNRPVRRQPALALGRMGVSRLIDVDGRQYAAAPAAAEKAA